MIGGLLLFVASAAFSPAPGRGCRLSAPLTVKSKDGAVQMLVPGTTLLVRDGAEGRWIVKSAGGEGIARDADLRAACVTDEPPPARAPGKKALLRVVVLDLRGNLPPTLLASLGAEVAKALTALAAFDAYTMADLKDMVSFEETRQLVGCQSNASCMAEIGGALGASHSLAGEVSRIQGGFAVQLQLIDNRRARLVGRVSRQLVGGEGGLFSELATATKLLVRELLALSPGKLRLRVSAEGASVRIDERVVGTSPLSELTLGGGMHSVRVEKDNYVPYAADLDVVSGQVVERSVALVISEEMVRRRVARARLVQGLAWSGAGLGVAGLAAGVALYVVSHAQALALAPAILAFNAAAVRTPDDEQSLRRRETAIAHLELGAVLSASVGLALLAAGIAVGVASDSPGRIATETGVKIVFAPSGLGGTLFGAF